MSSGELQCHAIQKCTHHHVMTWHPAPKMGRPPDFGRPPHTSATTPIWATTSWGRHVARCGDKWPRMCHVLRGRAETTAPVHQRVKWKLQVAQYGVLIGTCCAATRACATPLILPEQSARPWTGEKSYPAQPAVLVLPAGLATVVGTLGQVLPPAPETAG
jgi:hypothetical protein